MWATLLSLIVCMWMDPAHGFVVTPSKSSVVVLHSVPFSLGGPIVRAIELGGVPAIGMYATTVLGLKWATPPAVVGALQHFSAGILLTTVAKELLPEMVQADGWAENLASGVGFFSGVGLLILLGILLPEEEGEGEEQEETLSGPTEIEINDERLLATTPLQPAIASDSTNGANNRRLRNRSISRQREAFALEARETEESRNESKDSITATSDDDKTATPPTSSLLQLLPTAFLTAMVIDAALDGLLIGISTAVGDEYTGPILSASLLVESSFLGITIATALRGTSTSRAVQIAAAALGPIGTLAGSIAGGGLAPTLSESPVLLAGLLGFGTSTILFMVAEELLLEAHEEGYDVPWWVDFQLYTGFFASVMVEKLVGV